MIGARSELQSLFQFGCGGFLGTPNSIPISKGTVNLMALLGLDFGSTAIKADLYSVEGIVKARASMEYGEHVSNGELAADRLWSCLARVIGKIRKTSPGVPVRAVSISSHAESFVPVNKEGVAISPFILNTAPIATQQAGGVFGRIWSATDL